MNDETEKDDEILFEVRGALGLIILNRPKALNALTRQMCLALTAQLQNWAHNPAVKTVAIKGAGEKGFCAGGDIRALYESGKAGTSYVFDFYGDEYRLNTLIQEYPKPYMALIDGITMGGGVGVAIHGSHRIAGERTLFAMPETGIGLFPDVGGTYFLPRLSGKLGLYLGLTGARLKAADSVHTGVATHYVPSETHASLLTALSEGEEPDSVLERLAHAPDEPPLLNHLAQINQLFDGDSVEVILSSLEQEGSEWALKTKKNLGTKSPTALKITFRQLQEGAKLGFRDCMSLEYRLTQRVMRAHDFFEGVRAVVIDKDQSPLWQPASLAEVSDEAVDAYFAPLGDNELKFLS